MAERSFPEDNPELTDPGRADGEEAVPAEVRAFVHAHVPSVGHMEALVLTMEDSDRRWTAESLAQRLFVPQARAGDILRDLAAAGLVEGVQAVGAWRFAPRDASLGALAGLARRAYRRHLKAMTAVIHARPA